MILELEVLQNLQKTKILSKQVSSTPRNIGRFLLSIVAVLSLIALVFVLLKYSLNLNSGLFLRIHRLFNMNLESNIPTLFSALVLLLASLLLFFIYKTSIKEKMIWLSLSGLFLFLCIDEAAQLHENLNRIELKIEFFNQTSLKHVWVLPYLLLIILLGIFLKGFIFGLPARIRNLFILSGLMYIGGAAGLEIIEGQLKIYYGGSDFLSMELLYWLEETLEMGGVTLFCYALLDYIAPNGTKIFVKVNDGSRLYHSR